MSEDRITIQESDAYIENALDIGVDVVHISDDWGMNDAMLFSPSSCTSRTGIAYLCPPGKSR